MEKTMELKMLLESSLKRIFQATVTDILVSVEQTLSEYQGTIQTIQTENEGLKRLLSTQRSAESLHEGLLSSDGSQEDAAEQFSGSDGNNLPVTSTYTLSNESKCSNGETCFRKPNESKLKESASSPPFSLKTEQLEEESCVEESSTISVPVKTEPNLEGSGTVDLPQQSLNQMVKLVKSESLEVTCDAFPDVRQLHPLGPKHECRESDHGVKVTVVSKGYTQEGHFIKIEKEEEADVLLGSESESLSQSEVKYELKHQEAELDQKWLERGSSEDVEQEEGTLEQNNSTIVADEDTQIQSSSLFRCSTCLKTFKKLVALKSHVRSHGRIKDYSCKVCGRTFRRPDQLRHHNHTHTGERPFSCNLCSKAYTRSCHLSAHMRIHTGERPYACSHCEKSFRDCKSRKEHLQTHSEEKPYSCQECSKTFKCTKMLRRHMLTHSGETPHTCTQCGKRFMNHGNLKVHYMLHTGERPFSCKLCSKTFLQASNLKVHMRTHTGEKPYSCDKCSKKFAVSSSLKFHLKSHV
ncbi:zinc finger protein 37-like isoform X1 [Fundulus heteroclitus]|uniref:zinc finger protein 37-like isoform X1 n=1 Tax=Fundulus heteroclitus TaxID=8078 RepID=UPI00165AFFDD|nr:zinc finger protein 37-like isoform X1 [Fundulus heteroclitus]